MPDAIAGANQIEIGRILNWLETGIDQMVVNLLSSHRQKRADDPAVDRLDPSQSLDSRAVQNADKDRFDLIIGVMCRGDVPSAQLLSLPLEGLIANSAGCGLQILPRLHVLANRAVEHRQWDLEIQTEIAGQARPARGVPIQFVIDVDGVQSQAEFGGDLPQAPKEGGGVWPARKSDDDVVPAEDRR